ncbi:hypothetical protein MMK51_001018 [Proteus mirabilis]|uniref:hypothetical protein n=1 Tax=Proteus TaxID=583 RepID=UPI0012D30E06|nr:MULTISPECIES: hypothetical protein [Proteus]EKU0927961.1 hypothetical protein [Proteus mirabilis]EKU2831130.1 hypothetical protein [Proteus mirabilis]EKV7661551.1 hypothetical protein [Proteus mirabilis]ELB0940674.1 hypothetical protein [Proteus mirabilis]ELT8663785.1 hypothetical protein [Proteus mirabilis]
MEELENLIKEIAIDEGITFKDAIKLAINVLRINQANQPDENSTPVDGGNHFDG